MSWPGQEDMRDQIKQVAEGHLVTQAMLKQGFEGMRTYIDRRLDPLERTVREHSEILRGRA